MFLMLAIVVCVTANAQQPKEAAKEVPPQEQIKQKDATIAQLQDQIAELQKQVLELQINIGSIYRTDADEQVIEQRCQRWDIVKAARAAAKKATDEASPPKK